MELDAASAVCEGVQCPESSTCHSEAQQCEQPPCNFKGVCVKEQEDWSRRCSQPMDVGLCDSNTLPRHYYNTDSERCEQMQYGGCGGNSNHFLTRAECQMICEAEAPRHVSVSFDMEHMHPDLEGDLEAFSDHIHNELSRLMSTDKEYIQQLEVTPRSDSVVHVSFMVVRGAEKDPDEIVAMLSSKIRNRLVNTEFQGYHFQSDPSTLTVIHYTYDDDNDDDDIDVNTWVIIGVCLAAGLSLVSLLIVVFMVFRGKRAGGYDTGISDGSELGFSNEMYYKKGEPAQVVVYAEEKKPLTDIKASPLPAKAPLA